VACSISVRDYPQVSLDTPGSTDQRWTGGLCSAKSRTPGWAHAPLGFRHPGQSSDAGHDGGVGPLGVGAWKILALRARGHVVVLDVAPWSWRTST
jgi:hypothetical protein